MWSLSLQKQNNVVSYHVPKYQENIEFYLGVDDFYVYFSDYQISHHSELDFLFKVLSTLKGNELKDLISQSNASRSAEN